MTTSDATPDCDTAAIRMSRAPARFRTSLMSSRASASATWAVSRVHADVTHSDSGKAEAAAVPYSSLPAPAFTAARSALRKPNARRSAGCAGGNGSSPHALHNTSWRFSALPRKSSASGCSAEQMRAMPRAHTVEAAMPTDSTAAADRSAAACALLCAMLAAACNANEAVSAAEPGPHSAASAGAVAMASWAVRSARRWAPRSARASVAPPSAQRASRVIPADTEAGSQSSTAAVSMAKTESSVLSSAMTAEAASGEVTAAASARRRSAGARLPSPEPSPRELRSTGILPRAISTQPSLSVSPAASREDSSCTA